MTILFMESWNSWHCKFWKLDYRALRDLVQIEVSINCMDRSLKGIYFIWRRDMHATDSHWQVKVGTRMNTNTVHTHLRFTHSLVPRPPLQPRAMPRPFFWRGQGSARLGVIKGRARERPLLCKSSIILREGNNTRVYIRWSNNNPLPWPWNTWTLRG